MDEEGKERDESRSSTEPNTRRSIATKKNIVGRDQKATRERWRWPPKSRQTGSVRRPGGLRASTSGRQAAAQQDGPVQGEQRIDWTGKAHELVSSLVGLRKKEALSSPLAAGPNCGGR